MACLRSTCMADDSQLVIIRPSDDDFDRPTSFYVRGSKNFHKSGRSNRSFTVAGQRLWNNLPPYQRDSELTLLKFHRLLQTHLLS